MFLQTLNYLAACVSCVHSRGEVKTCCTAVVSVLTHFIVTNTKSKTFKPRISERCHGLSVGTDVHTVQNRSKVASIRGNTRLSLGAPLKMQAAVSVVTF